MAQTLFDKLWAAHLVASTPDGADVIYIDRHYIHEVTSPQAFGMLEEKGIEVRRSDRTTATADHNVPTKDQHLPISEELSRAQVDVLGRNCSNHGIDYYGLQHENQGIVHVIGPELGLTRPGMTIVCGDSHTSTHGAFGCIAFGIGTSQVAQVFATQCIIMPKPRKMRITVQGTLRPGVVAKDIALYVISKLGTGGCTGHFVEYDGEAITNLSMEGRMTLCNMSIEMGARGGLVAPDDKTIDYVKGRKYAPEEWDVAVSHWQTLTSDEGAVFDKEVVFDAGDIQPMLTYGTNPGMAIGVDEKIPESLNGSSASHEKALQYMGLNAGDFLLGQKVDYVFVGSCTNARIEDLRAAASVIEGRQKAGHVEAWVIPGSNRVRAQAISEGLDKVFTDAGFEFREPGCSACLGMNEDKIPAGAYCISTSNRNFEGRQGPGARTILASPLMAASAAVAGHIVDVRNEIA